MPYPPPQSAPNTTREPAWVLEDEVGSHDASRMPRPFRTNGALLWPLGLMAAASTPVPSQRSDRCLKGEAPRILDLVWPGSRVPKSSSSWPGSPSRTGAARLFLTSSQARSLWRLKLTPSERSQRWGWGVLSGQAGCSCLSQIKADWTSSSHTDSGESVMS